MDIGLEDNILVDGSNNRKLVASEGRPTVDVLTRVYQFVVDREPVASCVAIKKGV